MRVRCYAGVFEASPHPVCDIKWPEEDLRNPNRRRLASRAPYWMTPQLMRAARAYHGWTLQYISQSTGIHLATFSKFERGNHRVLAVGTIIRILQFFAQRGIRFTGDETGPRGLSIASTTGARRDPKICGLGVKDDLVDSIKVAVE